MLTPNSRRDIVLDFLAAWEKYPQLRFCQLVQFLAGEDDPFYMDDNIFRQRIRLHTVKED